MGCPAIHYLPLPCRAAWARLAFLLLSGVWRRRQAVLAVIRGTAAKIVETIRPVETSHAWRVFCFHRMQSFHDPAVGASRILLLSGDGSGAAGLRGKRGRVCAGRGGDWARSPRSPHRTNRARRARQAAPEAG